MPDRRAVLASLVAGVFAPVARAADGDDFYRDKTITIVVGYGPGGGFDLYARLLAEHLPAHLPGLRGVIVSNMPGASSLKAAGYLASIAPQDGTVLAIVNESVPLMPIVDPKNIDFDPSRLRWIGRLGVRPSMGVVWHSTGIRDIAGARGKSPALGCIANTDYSYHVLRAVNAIAGTGFRPVLGYPGTPEILLAMERGEVDGLSFAPADEILTGARAKWPAEGKIAALFVNSLKRLPEFPSTPTLVELAGNDEDRAIMRFLATKIEIGRSFMAGPGVPAARIATLRKAFDAVARDERLIAGAAKRNIDVSALSGEDLSKLVGAAVDIPDALARRIRVMVAPD